MLLLYSLFVLSSWTSSIYGHLCVWAPMQRGDFDISNPGSHVCYRKPPPCGNVNATSASPRTKLVAGSQYTVKFQQNLNHYYTDKPGSLDISFATGLNPNDADFRVLYSFSDYNSMNQITQTNFSITINLPSEPCDQCVLRVRYLTNNPDEDDHGTVFHQCSDVQLTRSSMPIDERTPVVEPVKPLNHAQDDPHDCCAPESYIAPFFHTIPEVEFFAEGLVFYDQKSRQMRVTVQNNGGRGKTTYDGIFDMWMNFTSGYQYYYNRNTGACDLYGLDYWNDWCFGNKYNQSEDFVASEVPCSGSPVSGNKCNQWRNGEFLFETYTTGSCYPAAISRPSGERYDFLRGTVDPIPPSTFVPDPACLKQMKMKHASPGWMKIHV